MKRLAVFSIAVVLASSAAAASFAQEGGGGMRQACGAEMAKLCPDVQPGPARRQCIAAHRDQFSDTCKSAMAAARARREAAKAAAAAAPPASTPPAQ